MKNSDMPAMPYVVPSDTIIQPYEGMTKREIFCLQSGVADTGDEGLNAIIRKANRQKMAAHICSGFISGGFDLAGPRYRFNELVSESVSAADALLEEMERTK